MKSIICRKAHPTGRIVFSLILQILIEKGSKRDRLMRLSHSVTLP
jgi:hypothetical protein